MPDERRPSRDERESRKYRRYDRQYSGQGGGYGQSNLGLNYEGTGPREDGPYRVPPPREGGGYHHGAYAARHYHGFSEREPGGAVDRMLQRWSDLPDYTGRGPRNYTRSDAHIEDDVALRLTHSDALDASGIDLTVQNGAGVLATVRTSASPRISPIRARRACGPEQSASSTQWWRALAERLRRLRKGEALGRTAMITDRC